MSGTQHTIVDVVGRKYSTVSTGSFSLAPGSQRDMLDTDWILMASAGKFILAIALLSKGVGMQSTVSSICGGYCDRMPESFYDRFNIGALTVNELLNHQTTLPDFINAGSESVTMKAYSGSAPVPNELNPVLYEIVVNDRPVLDAEKFQLLTDLYNETLQNGYSNTNYLVVQYLLEHVAVKPTRYVLVDDLGLHCDPAYDSTTGGSYGTVSNVASSYWTFDNVHYADVVRSDTTLSATPDSLQGAIVPYILQTAGPSGNLYCSTRSVADLLLRVVDGLVPNVALSDLVTISSSFEPVTIDGSSLTSVGASGTGGAEARILVDASTTNAKYVVVGSFNVVNTSVIHPDGVPELLAGCF